MSKIKFDKSIKQKTPKRSSNGGVSKEQVAHNEDFLTWFECTFVDPYSEKEINFSEESIL